ncbi:MAG TPA: hypothetical protein VF796_00925 [Humisphaera sp.]
MPDWKKIPWSGGEVDELHARPGEPLIDALVPLWLRTFEWLAAVESRHPWDTVTACIRPDSGRIRLVASRGEDDILGGPPDLVSPDLEERWYGLPDPQEDDDDADVGAFDAAAAAMMADVVSDLRRSLRDERVAAALEELRRRCPLRMLAMEFDDAETTLELL